MQEIQERPQAGDEGNEGVWGGAPPRTPISESANQPISEALHGAPRDAGAPGKRAADEDFRRPTRRETEGGYATHAQRLASRACARSVLCFLFSVLWAARPPSVLWAAMPPHPLIHTFNRVINNG